LIERTASSSNKTIVLLEGGSAIQVSDWLESVDALLMVWYPGREGGNAIANVLFGRVAPSGKLPVSFPKTMNQLMDWDINALDVDHDLLHGYRYLDFHDHNPQFPFGFGLSYTSFVVGELNVERSTEGFKVLVAVTNTGERQGAEVVQLYVETSESGEFRVPRELKAFGRVSVNPGETIDLLMEIKDSDLCYYDMDKKDWQLETCRYELKVGTSSRNLPLSSSWLFDGNQWLAD
jgi:beta-glucosidase